MKICSNKDFEFLVKDQSLRLKALAKARTEKNPAGNLEVSDLNSLINACSYTGDVKSTKFLKHLKAMVENGEFYQLQAKHVLGDWDVHQVHIAELHRKGEIAFDIGSHVLLKDSGKRGMVVDYLPEEKEFLVVLDPFQLKSFPKKELEKIAQLTPVQNFPGNIDPATWNPEDLAVATGMPIEECEEAFESMDPEQWAQFCIEHAENFAV